MRKCVPARNDQHMPDRTPELPARPRRGRPTAPDRGREWERGQALPGVPALAEHYGVARATVSRAIHALADDGLVVIVSRWGTFRA